MFGFCYRTLIGNDTVGTNYGYKLHLVYGAQASPSEKNNQTVNDSPEAATMSWEISTTPVDVPNFKPTAHLVIDSTKTDKAKLAKLEEMLYGTDGDQATRAHSPDAREGHRAAESCRPIYGTRTSKAGSLHRGLRFL